MVQHPLAFPCASRKMRLDVASCSISSTGRRPATLFRASQRRRTPRRLLGRKLPTQNAPTVRARGVLTQFARPRQPRGNPRRYLALDSSFNAGNPRNGLTCGRSVLGRNGGNPRNGFARQPCRNGGF